MVRGEVGLRGVSQLGTFWVKVSPLGSLWDFWCQVGTFGKLYLIGWVKRGISTLSNIVVKCGQSWIRVEGAVTTEEH